MAVVELHSLAFVTFELIGNKNAVGIVSMQTDYASLAFTIIWRAEVIQPYDLPA